ncbi:mitochondrial ribosomal protein L37-domain-containing protein, partial [Jimgerdemannia flammicorona]
MLYTKTKRSPSSVLKGQPLKGISYLKNAPDPIALADDEYPDWLWDLLDENKQRAKVENPANRQFHKKANREAIKAANFMSNKKTEVAVGVGGLKGAVSERRPVVRKLSVGNDLPQWRVDHEAENSSTSRQDMSIRHIQFTASLTVYIWLASIGFPAYEKQFKGILPTLLITTAIPY